MRRDCGTRLEPSPFDFHHALRVGRGQGEGRVCAKPRKARGHTRPPIFSGYSSARVRVRPCLSVFFLFCSAAASAQPVDLSTFAPQVPIPQRPIAFAEQTGPAWAELAGIDLFRDGAALGPKPAIEEGAPITLAAYWRMLAPAPTSASLRIEIDGAGPSLQETFYIDAAGWAMGGLYRQEYTFALSRGRYSGRASMRFFTQNARPGAQAPEALLYALPIAITPVVLPSQLTADALASFFNGNVTPLDASFRLGPGASITVPVPPGVAGPFTGVAVVSSLGYDAAFTRGAAICTVQPLDADGDGLQWNIRAGYDTAPSDLALRPDSVREGVTAPVFSSMPDPTRKVDGAPLVRNQYAARLTAPMPAAPASLRFTYLPDRGILDVKAVALIGAAQP